MSAIEPELEALATFRMNLDFEFERDDVQRIQVQIDRGEVPSDDAVISLAMLVEKSTAFRRITEPRYTASVAHIRELQKRTSRGEFIGTSRTPSSLPKPTIQTVSGQFELYANGLAEQPNSVLDILTATACYQGRLLLDKSDYDPIRGTEKIPQFPTRFVQEILCGSQNPYEFIKSATDFIHGADATATKSLEGSELGRFYAVET